MVCLTKGQGQMTKVRQFSLANESFTTDAAKGKEALLMWTQTSVLPSCPDEQLWHLGRRRPGWVSERANADLCERRRQQPASDTEPMSVVGSTGVNKDVQRPWHSLPGLVCKRNRIRKGRVPWWQCCQPGSDWRACEAEGRLG